MVLVEFKKLKVALYARVSTDEQDATQQIKDCESLNSWGEAQVFIENQSAWKDTKDRPEFEKTLKLIKAKQLDHLIVWDLDRLYRNRLKLIEFFKLCKVYGCQVHSYRQAWLNDMSKMPTPWNDIMFDLMLNIMGWLAEEESSKKSDRVKKATRQVEGQTMSYKGNKWGRKAINPKKLEMIMELMTSKRPLSVRSIAKEVNLSVGTVHKYMAIIQAQKNANSQRLAISQFTNNIEGGRLEKVYSKAFERIFRNEGWLELAKEASNPSTRTPPLNSKAEPKKDDSTETPQSQPKEATDDG